MKQTAVEWLYEELILDGINVPKVFYDKAKAMEKEQIIDAFKTGTKMVDVDNGLGWEDMKNDITYPRT